MHGGNVITGEPGAVIPHAGIGVGALGKLGVPSRLHVWRHMASHTLIGGCCCGKVTLQLNLASEPERYNPRVCDCDFCCRYDAAYISDPNGNVVVRTEAMSNLNFSQQGTKLAEFLFCASCEQLLGVRWNQCGSVNAQVLVDKELFGKNIPISPKMLSAEQKVDRWEELWFPEFVVITTTA